MGKDLSMVVSANAPPVLVIEPTTAAWLGDNPATDASIARYLGAGEGMLSIIDIAWKVFAALLVVLLVAWAVGLLPGAVRLF
jgi:hypothetical protein